MKSIFTKNTNNSPFHKENNNKVNFFHLTKNVRWKSLLNLLTTVKSIHAASLYQMRSVRVRNMFTIQPRMQSSSKHVS